MRAKPMAVFAHLFGSAIPHVLKWKYTGNCFHPTQKPVSVLTPLVVSFSNPGDVVLDPFFVPVQRSWPHES
jgi:hypothetical protein